MFICSPPPPPPPPPPPGPLPLFQLPSQSLEQPLPLTDPADQRISRCRRLGSRMPRRIRRPGKGLRPEPPVTLEPYSVVALADVANAPFTHAPLASVIPSSAYTHVMGTPHTAALPRSPRVTSVRIHRGLPAALAHPLRASPLVAMPVLPASPWATSKWKPITWDSAPSRPFPRSRHISNGYAVAPPAPPAHNLLPVRPLTCGRVRGPGTACTHGVHTRSPLILAGQKMRPPARAGPHAGRAHPRGAGVAAARRGHSVLNTRSNSDELMPKPRSWSR
jgi:hypothetical protein